MRRRRCASERLRLLVAASLLLAQVALLLAAAVHQHTDVRIAEPGRLRVRPVQPNLTSASEIEPLCVTCRVIRQCLAEISAGNSVPRILSAGRLKHVVAVYRLSPFPRLFTRPRAPPFA
jgi:hypothetical protein